MQEQKIPRPIYANKYLDVFKLIDYHYYHCLLKLLEEVVDKEWIFKTIQLVMMDTFWYFIIHVSN